MRKAMMIATAAVLAAAAVWVFCGQGLRLPATRSALGARVTLRKISRIDAYTVGLTVSVDDADLVERGERLLLDSPTAPVPGQDNCVSNMHGIPYMGPIPAPRPVILRVGIRPERKYITIEQPVVRDSQRRHATFVFKDVDVSKLPVTRRTSNGAVTLSRAYADFDPHHDSHGWEFISKSSSPPPYGPRYFGLVVDMRINTGICTTEMKLMDSAGKQLGYAGAFERKLSSPREAGWEWMQAFSGPDTAPRRFTFELSAVLQTPEADKAVVRWENVRVPPWRSNDN